MKSASELYEFTMQQKPKLVEKVLEGVREHIIECLDRDSERGATYYSIYLKQERAFVKDLLLEECIKLAKDFEDNGYKVSIDDSGNGYYIDFIMTFSWDGNVKCKESNSFGIKRHLYDTERGVIYTKEELNDIYEEDEEEDL